jgi:glycosyltransferase involved in cell wall biosynthesis
MKKISVAMAVYNGETYLSEQLDSILKQLDPIDEIVVSYDKSTDGTWDLLQDYAIKYAQVRVVENQNPGIAGNFNNAIEHCTGDYIFICDQDDRWADKKRETIVETFEKTGSDMVIHNGVHINGEGKVISEPFFSIYRIGDGKIKNILKPRYSGCCTAFTSDMAKKILPIPKDIDAYDHWVGTVGEFMGKIAYENAILLYHRLHGENATPTSTRSLSVILKARLRLIKELRARMKRERNKK